MRDPNFLAKRDPPVYEDGRDLADGYFKAMHRDGPQAPASLAKRAEDVDDEAVKLIALTSEERAEHLARHGNLATTSVIKKIHAEGARPLDPDELRKSAPVVERNPDRTVRAIQKCRAGGRTVDVHALNKMLERGRTIRELRKTFGVDKAVTLPPQNSNATWTNGPLADDGASGDWRTDPTPSAATTRLGPRHAASITDGRTPATTDDATVMALKAIFAGGPKREL